MSEYPVNHIAVFFEKGSKKEVGYKRIPFNTFESLTDGIEGKTVFLGEDEYLLSASVKTFSIVNSIDNNRFVICEVLKK